MERGREIDPVSGYVQSYKEDPYCVDVDNELRPPHPRCSYPIGDVPVECADAQIHLHRGDLLVCAELEGINV